MIRPAACLLLAFSLILGTAAAQDDLARANELLNQQDWSGAAVLLEKFVAAQPDQADAWTSLGLALRQLGRLEEALSAYEQGVRKGDSTLRARIGLAMTQTRLGRMEDAVVSFRQAIDQGMTATFLQTNPELAALREDSRYPELLAHAERISRPCEHDPKFRAFDFWVGTWEVFAGANRIGTNVIERDLHGCVLIERWTSAAGSRGISLNFLDPATGKWRQQWVADNGSVVWYEGEVRDGAMHYAGEQINPKGQKTLARVLLQPQPDGTVRHRIENSTDGGKTWTNTFDAIYRPASQSPPR
ncbi:tetratricopeptide repeat protein [bacterium]|nr:MAG: tetratricopeptide repeat protein [bacterium]